MSINLQQIAVERQRITQAIRSFFVERDFLEVDVPCLVKSPGMEPNLDPFLLELAEENKTHTASLITSPEYSMKKLLGNGLRAIFSLPHVFRNGEFFDETHNPEFTLLEWYRQGFDYHACMKETEELIHFIGKQFGKEFPKFKKISMQELFLEKTGLDLAVVGKAEMIAFCDKNSMNYSESDSESDLFYRIFITKIEPNLGNDPIFVYNYPKHQAALARLTQDKLFGERFELYINGIEICNGFTELVDSIEQKKRFIEESLERKNMGKYVFPIDEALISLLSSVANPTYGNALGVDRLHMVLTGRTDIRDVLLFPANRLFV